MRFLFLPVLLLLTACGFTPLHSEAYRAQTADSLAAIDVQAGTTRIGQLLKAEINDGINPEALAQPKQYVLAINLLEYEVALFINPDGTSSRGDVEYHSSYVLTRIGDNKIVDRGQIKRVSSYNTSEAADYSSYVSEEDARRRGIVELAQDYKLRLANLVPRLQDEAQYYDNRAHQAVPAHPMREGYENRRP